MISQVRSLQVDGWAAGAKLAKVVLAAETPCVPRPPTPHLWLLMLLCCRGL